MYVNGKYKEKQGERGAVREAALSELDLDPE